MNLTNARPFVVLALLALVLSAPASLGAQDRPLDTPKAQGDSPIGGGGQQQPPADPEGPFAAADVTTRAVIRLRPEPVFTEEAGKNGTEGVVRLRAVLAASGEVKNITVIKGLPDGLTQSAIAAAKQVKFTPARKDGREVSQWVTIDYHFNIKDEVVPDEMFVDRRAVIHERPEAVYTEEARRAGIKGKVVLRVILFRDGRTSASVVKGLSHGLTEKALEAAGKIKFTPAKLDGRPVSVVRRIEYVFKLP
jgi:TonB family protein